jgi:hypothetical protein
MQRIDLPAPFAALLREHPACKIKLAAEVRMIGTIEAAFLQFDRGERVDDTFGHRSQIVADADDIRGILSFGHDLSMPNHHKTVLLVGANCLG